MRLSEAIREGSKGKRQIQGETHDGRNGVCAMGAAYIGCGHGLETEGIAAFDVFPDAASIKNIACPSCGHTEGDQRWGLTGIIAHINDDHAWTFDQIADWVQAQEAIAGIGQEAEAPARELVNA